MSYHDNPRYAWPEYELGDPVHSGAVSVFPVLGGNGGSSDYMLLSDAVDKGQAVVTEVTEHGHVPFILVINHGTRPLLGIQGEEYVGAKQNRTLNVTILAGPGKTRIPVTCVEQGRWDHVPGTPFSAGTYDTLAMRTMKSMRQAEAAANREPASARYEADQGSIWDMVAYTAHGFGATSPTQAISDVYGSEQVQRPLDDITSGLELPADARGAVVAIAGRLRGADVFDHAAAFASLWPRLIRSYAIESLGHANPRGKPGAHDGAAACLTLEMAASFLSQPRDASWNAAPSVGLGEDVRWSGKRFVASALAWQERFLHASVFAA